MKKLLPIFIFIINTSILTAADFWEKADVPDIPPVASIVKNANGDIFACSHWVSKSTNGGESWEDANTVVSGNSNYNLYDLPYFYNKIVVAGNGYLFIAPPKGQMLRSTDYGASWHIISEEFEPEEVLCIDNNDVLYSANNGEFVVSTDYGDTWEIKYYPKLFSTYFIFDIVCNSSNDIIIDGYTSLKYKKANGEWKYKWPFTSDLENTVDLTCNDQEIFLLTSEAFYYSPDFGETWTRYNLILPSYDLEYEDIHYINGTIYLTSESGVHFKTTDNGKTWEEALPQFKFIPIYDIAQYEDEIYICGPGLWKSTDSLKSFEKLPVQPGYTFGTIQAEDSDSNLYCIMPGGIYTGKDTEWNIMPMPEGLNPYFTGSLNSTSNFDLYLNYDKNHYFHSDDGQNWELIEPDKSYRYYSPGKKGKFFFWSSKALVYTSNGYDFTEIEVPTTIGAVYIGENDEILNRNDTIFNVSTDLGLSWNNYTTTRKITWWRISDFAFVNNMIYVIYQDGVYYSSDYGKNWTGIDTINSLPQYTDWIAGSFYVNGQEIYVSCDKGAFRINAEDNTTEDLNSGLDSKVVRCIFHAADGYLYLSSNSGIYRSRQTIAGVEDRYNDSDFSLQANTDNDYSMLDLTISSSDSGNYSISIIDINGKIVYTSDKYLTGYTSAIRDIDISRLASGVYIINCSSESGAASAKFTIAR